MSASMYMSRPSFRSPFESSLQLPHRHLARHRRPTSLSFLYDPYSAMPVVRWRDFTNSERCFGSLSFCTCGCQTFCLRKATGDFINMLRQRRPREAWPNTSLPITVIIQYIHKPAVSTLHGTSAPAANRIPPTARSDKYHDMNAMISDFENERSPNSFTPST